MPVEFSVLGEVEARVDGRAIDLGHARQRHVLAALLVDVNRPVPAHRLTDRVWGEQVSPGAVKTLRSYLCRLRGSLAGSATIERVPGGYQLTVDPCAVDVVRFRDLAARARAAPDDLAAELYRAALGLWRGTALSGVDTPALNAVRTGWEREHLAAELDRNDIALRRGEHAAILPHLVAAAGAHPLDERLAGQLLLGLYRCGRQAEALDRYDELRRRLADELGADPSPPLRALHRQILSADGLTTTVRTATPRQLPAPPDHFQGRAGELRRLDARLTVICGPGGIGKTWLALRWAHDHAHEFPDGQLHVNLRGFDPLGQPVPPAVAVRGFLDALGVDPAAIPVDVDAQAALYRSLVAGKRLLIVADNARDTAQVLPLLPGTPTCAVLVTSRHQLAGLVTAHGARPLTLGVLTGDDARRLLAAQLGAERIDREPDAVRTVLRHCAGLPLALGIAAARAALRPDLPLAALAAELHTAPTRLDSLDAGELPADLRAVLACSVRVLPAPAARLFALLGLAPGADLGLPAIASLAAMPAPKVRSLLRQLAEAHLVQEHGGQEHRYRMHDLVRLYAAERAGRLRVDERRAALHRIQDHYLHTAYAADRVLAPLRDPPALAAPRQGVPEPIADPAAALDWFTAEHPVLLAAIVQARRIGLDTHVWQLAWSLTTYFDRRGHWHDRAATQYAALAAARRLGDRSAEASARRGLALAHVWLGRSDDATAELGHALRLYEELGDLAGQGHTQRSLAWVAARQRRPADALPHDLRALALFREAGHRHGLATALNAVGWQYAHLGEYALALDYCERARTLHEELGDPHGHAATLDSLGYAHHASASTATPSAATGARWRCSGRSATGTRRRTRSRISATPTRRRVSRRPPTTPGARRWRSSPICATPTPARSPTGSARRQPLWQSCDTARTGTGHPAAIVVVMNTLLKRGAMIAAFSVLALTAACDAKEDTASTAPKKDAPPAAEVAGTDQKASGKDGGPAKVVTAAELPDLKKLAACMNQQGVATAEPAVGKPFDTKAMDAAFGGADQAKFEKVLANCPDYKKLVVGVG